jgi:biopolymer transport protein TolR
MASTSNSDERLNVMPMLDIFSILITFLLMSFSAEPVSHDINEDIELPDSITLTALDEIPAIVVTKREIFVNDKSVSTIVDGDAAMQDRAQGAIFPLFTELQKLADANKRYLDKKAKSVDDNPTYLTMEMDKEHNFKLMKRIMLSAQQAEFIAFKLMVAKEMN